ncbi:ferritin-like protein [Larkinella arboricola]|uniref:Ferritin-like protein n=1 Tax=Larkinella arboricola TaxID=643671 RepID=A0A327X6V9_LARAB|nr:ferritin-like domain-containing protein [Larkinella arboricola]RAK02717.1 ferritin-like protein [Larkinella arboricola]
MNLFGIFSQIEKADAEAGDKLDFARRKMLKTATVAAAATPAFFVGMVNKAFAAEGCAGDAVAILKYALTLEYLERDFYRAAQFKAGLLPAGTRAYVVQIAKHEAQHVDLLEGVLGLKKNELQPKYNTGTLNAALADYDTFLTYAQALEDTGVRAYKGQAACLLEEGSATAKVALPVALRIHSVEARHAAAVRHMRGLRVWASSGENGMEADPKVYAHEDMGQQGGADLEGYFNLPENKMKLYTPEMAKRTVYESFDEPLTKDEVLAIAGPFFASMM